MADYDTTKWAPVDAPAAPPTESTFDTKKWAKVGASLGGKPAQMGVDRGPGFGENLKDTAERTLGYAGGAGVGSVGGPLGAALGGGVGATTADIDIARKHQAEYGTQPQLDPWSVAKDYGMNTLGAYAGEKVIGAAGSALKGALGFVRGEPGLVAGAEKAAQEVGIPKEEFFAQKADIERHTSGELKKLHESVAKEQTPEAQQGMFQQATGRTPEASMRSATLPAEASSALPGVGQVERQQRFYRDITAPLQRASDAWAEKRDKLMGPFMDQRVNAAPLMGAINEEQQYAQANAKSFSPAIQKLFASLQELGAPDPLAGRYTPEELAEMSPNVRANLTAAVHRMNQGQLRAAAIAPPTITRASALPMAEGAPQPTGPTVRELLGRRSEASRLASAATTATDRHAASSVADAVDETLTQINAPKLDKLNAQYRQFKTLYPRSFGRALSTAAHPSEFANQVFGNPERALNLINGANAEEKQTLRKLYADAVNENGIDFIKPQHEKVLAQLYPRTPLATPQGFANVTSKELGLKELLNSSPPAQQRFMQEVVPRARALTIEAMQKTTARAITDARKMGPLGLQIIQRIESSADPADPAKQFKVAIEAMTGVTPDQAAIASIQAGRAAKTSGASYYLDRAKNLTPIYASIGGPALAEGKVNYSVVMLAIGGAQKVGDLLRKPLLKALENPETATNYWRAIQNPSASGSLKTLGRATADAIMSDAIGETGKKAIGTTLEKEPAGSPRSPDNKPSDMTKEYDRATARQAAGKSTDPSRVEHLEKVNSDLRKSKTPDVHAGLRTGRLSMPAIKNLLKQQNQKTAPSLLAHLGPEDVKHLLALATPEERAWLEPLAQQRLGNG